MGNELDEYKEHWKNVAGKLTSMLSPDDFEAFLKFKEERIADFVARQPEATASECQESEKTDCQEQSQPDPQTEDFDSPLD